MFNLYVEDKIHEIFGDVFCPTCKEEKRVYSATNKTLSFYDCKKCKTSCHVIDILFRKQKPTLTLFGELVEVALQKRRAATTKSFLFCWTIFSAIHYLPQRNLN